MGAAVFEEIRCVKCKKSLISPAPRAVTLWATFHLVGGAQPELWKELAAGPDALLLRASQTCVQPFPWNLWFFFQSRLTSQKLEAAVF